MSQIVLYASLILILVLFVIQSVRLRQRERQLADAIRVLTGAEKMAGLGRLLAGIAHELNTPLGAIGCALNTRRRALAALNEAESDDSLVKMRAALATTDPVLDEALRRTDGLIRQLRLAGRGETDEPEQVDVNRVLEGALLLASHELKHEVTVQKDLDEIPTVSGSAGQLGQVFLNLLVNASQALDGSGTITISTRLDGDRVLVIVTDTGMGLPPGDPEQLFAPGFTTKGEDEGTGLGLHISRWIIQKHGGSISAESGPSGGAVFTVALPVEAGRPGAGG